MAEGGATVAGILADITSIVTSAVTWLGDIASAVWSNKLILFFVVFGFVGTGIGIFRRLTR